MAVKWWLVILTMMILLVGFFLGLFLGGEKGPLSNKKAPDTSNRTVESVPALEELKLVGMPSAYLLEFQGMGRVGLALLKPPGFDDPRYLEALTFASSICPVGTLVDVDWDEGQSKKAVVYCKGRNLNNELLEKGYASIDQDQLGASVFDPRVW